MLACEGNLVLEPSCASLANAPSGGRSRHLSGFVTCGSRIKPSTSRDAVHCARFARLLLFIFYFFVGYAITLGLPNVLLELHAATPRHVPVSSWFTFFASFQQPRCRPLSLQPCQRWVHATRLACTQHACMHRMASMTFAHHICIQHYLIWVNRDHPDCHFCPQFFR